MNYFRGVAIFGGIGALGCLILWFGIKRFWYVFNKEKTTALGPEKMKRLERALAIGLVLFEVVSIGVGVAVAAGDPHP